MHVDGFRFDLAATLAREFYEVDQLSTFFELIQQDPVVSQVKLIAEPWDVGPGGYQVGNFPPLWTEWNGKYRDTVRDFWRGEPATLGEFASRLTGSADLYENSGRRPVASSTSSPPTTASRSATWSPTTRSTTRPTARATATANRTTGPGTAVPKARPTTRRCWPCGAANSATSSPPCCCPRACRCCSHGDELGRTQRGNNNAYCQDSELTWITGKTPTRRWWSSRPLSELRHDHPTSGAAASSTAGRSRGEGEPLPDIVWLTPDGDEMPPEDWDSGFGRSIGVFLNGDGIRGRDQRGQRITDDSFLLLFNAHDDVDRLHRAGQRVRRGLAHR